jgi:hypothetical protein
MPHEWVLYWDCSLKKFFGVDLAGPAEAMAAKARMEAATEAFMVMDGFGESWITPKECLVGYGSASEGVASSKKIEGKTEEMEGCADSEVRLLLLLIHPSPSVLLPTSF